MLDGIRVLDLTDERGQLCGMMLADLGADVVCIEPPGGADARRLGPFAGGATPGASQEVSDAEKSLFWWAYARNKRSAVVDLETADGRAQFLDLADRADVVIESAAPGYMASLGLSRETLSQRNPALVTVSITPFGQDGPKANWPASDLTVLAAGGPLWLTGDQDRPPTHVRVSQGFHHAACEAAAAAMIALHERVRSGLGQHVDVSAQQAVTLATQSDAVAVRLGIPGDTGASRSGGGGVVGPITFRFVYPAADGFVAITHMFGSAMGLATGRMMECVYEDGFCDQAMRDRDWVEYGGRLTGGMEPAEEWEKVKAAVASWSGSHTKAELLALSMERKLLIAPVSTTQDALESPQLEARAYFDEWERPDGRGFVRAPGAWAKFSRSGMRTARRAPRLGEHTDEVLAEVASRPRVPSPPKAESHGLPLEGVKILDFMWALAGPFTTRLLADYGATVVRIESSKRFDPARTLRPFVPNAEPDGSALFHAANIGKRMITLDIANPESRDVVLDLVKWADVVCESFAPGTFKRMGFGYEALQEKKSDLIMLSTSLMGQTGPLSQFAGYGNLGAAVGGFHELTGWADRPPAGPFSAYTDYVAPRFSACAVLAALEHRRRTGEGQHIDLSQAEVGLQFLAPAVLAMSAHGELISRAGNAHELYAPHGCYPVEGDDRWIAIAVEEGESWQALCDTTRSRTDREGGRGASCPR
jgi:crotonobetainyl-CoA:carnitine CoA-transferase CaiB-like acyl-CoA transferase